MSPLFKKLSKVVEELEKKNPSKRRGRPAKIRIGTVMQFNDSNPEAQNLAAYAAGGGQARILPYPPVKITVITPTLRTDSKTIYDAPDCLVPGVENYNMNPQTFHFAAPAPSLKTVNNDSGF